MIEHNPNHYRIEEIVRESDRMQRGFFKQAPPLPERLFVSGLGDFGYGVSFTTSIPDYNRIINFLVDAGVGFGVEARDFLGRPAVGFSRQMRDDFPLVCARIVLMCELAVNRLLII